MKSVLKAAEANLIHYCQQMGEEVQPEIKVKLRQAPRPEPDKLLPKVKNIIAIASGKGGVGKSATAINLAASLARFGKSSLLIDLDPQSNSSKGLGLDPTTLDNSIFEVMKDGIDINKAIRNTTLEGFDLIPSKLMLSSLEANHFEESNPLLIFKKSLHNLHKIYDFIILDCPSSMSFLTLNCLAAANSVLEPVQCEPFALDATTQILTKIINVQTTLNPDLEIEGFLLTMYDSKTSLCVEIANEIRQLFKENTFLIAKSAINYKLLQNEEPICCIISI